MTPVYLDSAATTRLTPEVREEILRFLEHDFGNAGSRTHEFGLNAKRRVNRAREEVASVVAARSDEILFTSGATESNNLAILGLERALREAGRTHVLSSRIEHKAVLEPIELLRARGFDVELLDVDEAAVVSADAVKAALRPETGLVSVMHVNNETGTIQPISSIADGLGDHAAYLHVDAAQGFGKEFDQLTHPRIDLISASAHKLNGPKGIGALVARRRKFAPPPLEPLMVGGGQERGLRPGTQAVHLIAGFGTACSTAVRESAARNAAVRRFREVALDALRPLGIEINGDPTRTVPNILNVSIAGVDAEAALVATRQHIAISNGSACTSAQYSASHVLTALGLPEQRIAGALRLSWDHATPDPNWDGVVEALRSVQSVALSR